MQRLGRVNRPFYRISAIDQRTRRDGVVIETLGWYNPVEKTAEKQLNINEDRVKHWLAAGAQPSDTVRDFLAKRGIGDLQAWEAERARQRDLVEKKKAAAAAAGEKKDDEKKA
jgi:small subunit ribosomal protein S16